MTTQSNPSTVAQTELIGSRIGRIDPDNFENQSGHNDGPPAIDDDDDPEEVTDEESDLSDEPTDEAGNPTGEHDHHQDDNYALGGHVTRSGSV